MDTSIILYFIILKIVYWWDRFVDLKSQKTMMSRKDIETIDSESLTIPLMTPDEYSILLKILK